MDDEQTPEEVAAHYAPGGPVATAINWLQFVIGDNDLISAWPLTDEPVRETLVRAFLSVNERHPYIVGFDVGEAIAALAAATPDHALWDLFAETQLREFAEQWPWVTMQTIGAASRPRLIAPDVEAVVLVRADGGPRKFNQTMEVEALTLHMRHLGDGWVVTHGGAITR